MTIISNAGNNNHRSLFIKGNLYNDAMGRNRQNIRNAAFVVVAWLIAAALIYLVIVKLRLFFK